MGVLLALAVMLWCWWFCRRCDRDIAMLERERYLKGWRKLGGRWVYDPRGVLRP